MMPGDRKPELKAACAVTAQSPTVGKSGNQGEHRMNSVIYLVGLVVVVLAVLSLIGLA